MSHCRASSLYDHLDLCFVVLKHTQLNFWTRRVDVWGNKFKHYPNHWSLFEIACVCESCEVENKVHSCSWTSRPVPYDSDSCFQGLKQSNPTNREREYRLISIQCPKRWFSHSVVLCETAVCFLHIKLIGTNVWLPKTHYVPPEVDFESSRSPAKSESWNSPSLHCLAVFPTWQYCLCSLVWWRYEINRFRRLSQALVHFVMDRTSLFTDHKISGRPILAKYTHFRTIWEHTCDNSPTDFISSSLKWWSSMHGVDTL